MYRVAVIKGGPSSEHDISLETSKSIFKAIEKLRDKYVAYDVFVTKDGKWHFRGLPIHPHELPKHVDVVFNAMHGDYGEDGFLQSILDDIGLPYTGSGSAASMLGMNKVRAKRFFEKIGIKTPQDIVFHFDHDGEQDPGALAHIVYQKFAPPWIVKPIKGGSSVNTFLCKSFPELVEALSLMMDQGKDTLVEEYISGREGTVGVVEGLRGENFYSLPAVEIKTKRDFFDKVAKYTGESEEICPGNFSEEDKKQMASIAKDIHEKLGLRHYSRTDFRLHPKKGVYVLEVNTLPGFTSESLLPKSLNAVGMELHEFVDHLLQKALGL